MLTVMVKNTGHEIVFEAKEFFAVANNSLNHIDELNFTETDGRSRIVREGAVYVMNSAGKTVASYELRPHEDDKQRARNGAKNNT